jgi:integrative and conjugative element protein (TIGR02256 family)
MFDFQIRKFGTIETGGVLMGHLTNGTLYVEKASDPGPNAIHELTYFRADANYIDMYIDMEFANSNGENIYLGEWHTHPQTFPEPSPTDTNSLAEIAQTSEEYALLLILGAVDFSRDFFSKQHILLLKYKNDRRFYSL